MPSPTPAQRIRRWHTYLIVWAAHRVLGLGVGVLILLASLTGGLLVMHHELERFLERDRQTLATLPPAGAARQSVTTLAAAAALLAPPSYRPFRYMPGEDAADSDKILFVSPDGRGTRWSAFVDPYTSEVLWHGPDTSLLTPWLLALHMHLHVGPWGYVITALGGAGLFLLGLTGLYLHRDRVRTLFRNPFRRHRSARLTFTDVHKWLGIASIYFSLILGLTGLIYCITIAPNQLAAPKPLAAPFDITKLTAIEPLIATARARFPEGRIQRVAFPTTAKAPLTILILERGAPVWRKFSRIEFDPVSGTTRAIRDAREATPREKFAAMLAPLHMGIHGSALTKWLYVIGGFAPAVLALTGTAIWWLRTRSTRGRSSTVSVHAAAPIGSASASPRSPKPAALLRAARRIFSCTLEMTRFRQALFWVHLVAGLLAGVSIAIMCATGTILAFEKEIVAWAERDARRVEAPASTATRLSLDEMQARLRAARPDFRPATIVIYNDPLAAVAFSAGRTGGVYVNPYTGDVRQPRSRAVADFMHLMVDWHRVLGLHGEKSRPVGKLINGICNLAFFLLAATGLYLWMPRQWTWRALRPVIWFRQNASSRARDFNWHNAIGFWAAPVLIVLTLTAVPISFRWGGTLIHRLTGTPVPATGSPASGAAGSPALALPAPPAGAKPLASDVLIAAAQLAVPTWQTLTFRTATPAGGTASPVTFTIREQKSWPRTATTTLALDPFTGQVLRRSGYAELNAAQQVRAWTRFLHTGEAVGPIGQLLAGLASLGGVFLVYTGVALSCRRFFGSRVTPTRESPTAPVSVSARS